MPTIKQIAHLAGVSRGTVDRVLNDRGAVSQENADKVREIAEALNYSPNRLGKTLTIRKRHLKFGYILFSSTASNAFFEDVVKGIQAKTLEFEEYGISIETLFAEIDNPELQVSMINELMAQDADGFVITPINHPTVSDRLAELAEQGVPFVTANSDIPNCGRIAYVGSDYYKSGRTAGELMQLAAHGKSHVGIILGSEWVLCHSQRVAGFSDYLKEYAPDLHIVDIVKNNDDDLESYAVTRRLLAEHPEIDSLFLAAAGVTGACRAVTESNRKLTIISHDVTRAISELVRKGIITATISQQPFTQGAKPLDLLFEKVGMDISPIQDCYYTKIEIKLRENL